MELVKPGGILVYSTCTITLEENEQNVAWVLEKFPQMELVTINSHVGSPGIIQVGHYIDFFYNFCIYFDSVLFVLGGSE